MKRRVWILLAVLFVLLTVSVAGAVWARIPEYLISGHLCSDAEAQFAESLSRDPLVTQPPPGIALIAQQPLPEPFQPCEGNSDNRYYGGVVRGFDLPATSSGLAEVAAHYRDLATANGWQLVSSGAGELVGQKMIDGTAVVFHLSGLEHKPHYTAYWVELRYAELGSSRYLLTLEDTFQ